MLQLLRIFSLFMLAKLVLGKGGFRGGGRGGGEGDDGPRGNGPSNEEDFFAPPHDGMPGPWRGNGRGGGGFRDDVSTTLACEEDESFACGSRRLGNETGIFACRTKPTRFGNITTTVCVDPEQASIYDECGCCDGACPMDCTCECNDGQGYWLQGIRKDFPRYRYQGGNGEDNDNENDMEEDALQILICAPKMEALTMVASGRATCKTECTL